MSHAPAAIGSYLEPCSPAHDGIHSTIASMLMLQKEAMEIRRATAATSLGGLMTCDEADNQRALRTAIRAAVLIQRLVG